MNFRCCKASQSRHEVFLRFAQSFANGVRYLEAQASSRKEIQEKLLIVWSWLSLNRIESNWIELNWIGVRRVVVCVQSRYLFISSIDIEVSILVSVSVSVSEKPRGKEVSINRAFLLVFRRVVWTNRIVDWFVPVFRANKWMLILQVRKPAWFDRRWWCEDFAVQFALLSKVSGIYPRCVWPSLFFSYAIEMLLWNLGSSMKTGMVYLTVL